MKRLIGYTALLFGLIALGACMIDDFDDRHAEMTNFSEKRPLGKEKSVNYNLEAPIGQLRISAGDSSQIFNLNSDFDDRTYKPDFDYHVSGDRGEFRFRFDKAERHRWRSASKTHVDLEVNPTLVSEFSVKTGVGESEVNLTGIPLKRLVLEAGVGETTVSMYEPNRERCDRIEFRAGVGELRAVGLGYASPRELKFEGGVGEANLDLTGEWKEDANVDVKVGIGAVNIRLPREVGVQLHVEKNFLSGLSLSEFKSRGDGEYVSENYDRAKVRLRMHVTAGIGSVQLSWK